jgi:hypothetical protein
VTARRRRLVEDVHRTVGLMAAVLADARRARVEVPDGVTASVTVWRSWAADLDPTGQAGHDDPGGAGPAQGGPPLWTRPHDWPPDRP